MSDAKSNGKALLTSIIVNAPYRQLNKSAGSVMTVWPLPTQEQYGPDTVWLNASNLQYSYTDADVKTTESFLNSLRVTTIATE